MTGVLCTVCGARVYFLMLRPFFPKLPQPDFEFRTSLNTVISILLYLPKIFHEDTFPWRWTRKFGLLIDKRSSLFLWVNFNCDGMYGMPNVAIFDLSYSYCIISYLYCIISYVYCIISHLYCIISYLYCIFSYLYCIIFICTV